MTAHTQEQALNSTALESFVYDDAIVRKFLTATLLWGVVGMTAGVFIALQMVLPALSFDQPWLSFGRLRPLHTNAVIFAFAGNAIFAAVYYSTQRLCKTRMYSDLLSRLHFWGWQLIIVLAALTLPLGITQGKEYAELEWPIDLLIAVVWLGFFGGNFFMTLKVRRERHLYVALWFYIATIVTVTVLHVFNNLWIPVFSGTMIKSYPIYAGVQDAFMQWWYGHNAVAFFLTTPFLGLMYYFVPKAANRPVFSYRLSILHFWSLVFIYIWAGPHHLHYTSLPEWASTLGMIFSVMLWMPSWGGGINGLLTLRGAWHKVPSDPILKFFVVGITAYMMATFEGPTLSVKSVNALTHYTDWTIAHVHMGALGWNGMLTFGMAYWLAPRLFQNKLWSKKLMATHFWVATVGIGTYVLPIYAAGLMQGLMWRDLDDKGVLVYQFIESVRVVNLLYILRALGGVLFLTGAAMCSLNLLMTWKGRPAEYDEPVHQAPALSKQYHDTYEPKSRLPEMGVLKVAHKLDLLMQLYWHRRWERKPFRFTVYVVIAVAVASLFEIIPTFLIRTNVPTISTVSPYTPLELAGRDLYLREGCYNCHSQMIRPILAETKRYGDYSKPGEFVYDHPFQWGSRRIGPDLAREGKLNPNALWHVQHFLDPGAVTEGSIMPAYPWLAANKIDWKAVPQRMKAVHALGVPYSDEELANAVELAEEQASAIGKSIVDAGGPSDLHDREMVALIAYIQRLGTDIYKAPVAADAPAETTAQPEAAAVAANESEVGG